MAYTIKIEILEIKLIFVFRFLELQQPVNGTFAKADHVLRTVWKWLVGITRNTLLNICIILNQTMIGEKPLRICFYIKYYFFDIDFWKFTPDFIGFFWFILFANLLK